jgi:hypothetical protein
MNRATRNNIIYILATLFMASLVVCLVFWFDMQSKKEAKDNNIPRIISDSKPNKDTIMSREIPSQSQQYKDEIPVEEYKWVDNLVRGDAKLEKLAKEFMKKGYISEADYDYLRKVWKDSQVDYNHERKKDFVKKYGGK